MAILTGENKKPKSGMEGNKLSTNMINQIDSIIEKGDGKSVSATMGEGERKKKVTAAKQKERNADSLLLVLPKGERAAFKSFCADNHLSMTEYIYTCMDFVRGQVQDGKMRVSKGGIRILKDNQ